MGCGRVVQHCNLRMEAYVAAAGGILLIAITGPLASYTYVLQYLLIGENQRMGAQRALQ